MVHRMNIHVSSPSFDESDETLWTASSENGEAHSARAVADQDSGRSRGFGIDQMAKPGESGAAITADSGTELAGRPATSPGR